MMDMLREKLGAYIPKIMELLLDCGLSILCINSTIAKLDEVERSLKAKENDVIYAISDAKRSGRKKTKYEVKLWLENVRAIQDEFFELRDAVQSKVLIGRFQLGCRDKKLKEYMHELIKQCGEFGELVVDDGRWGQELPVKRLVGKAFENNLKAIWERLVNGEVRSIGIYGMGGAGKTALTKHINNKLVNVNQKKKKNKLVNETRDCVLWVTVSEVGNVSKLQVEIARVLGIRISDECDEDKRAAILYGALSQRKNFVLILDDVWGDINLEKLGSPLSVKGGRLIITTRSLDVCHRIGCGQVIEVKTLSEDEAWELFVETLGQETTALSPQIQEVAKSMVKVCDGLPLGITTIAGGMRGETDVRVWRDALVELKESVMGQHEMEDKVFKVLKYSFDRLDPDHIRQGKSNTYTELQLCFLYCSLYPEDYRIQRKEVIEKLMSVELVGKRERLKETFDKGHSIINKLVNVCLLERSHEYEDADDDSVKMHDLVRAVALRITQHNTMVIAGDESLETIPDEVQWTTGLEKVSLMHNDIRKIPGGMSPNCPELSTLLLQRNKNLQSIADSFFSRMPNLSTLDLSYTGIDKLPNSLSELENLKALILHKCVKLVSVPDLGKMKALKELDLSFTRIKKVPQGMKKLVNLKFLLMEGIGDLKMLPKGLLLNFPKLQRLHLPSTIEAPVTELDVLKELEEFSGRVKSRYGFNRFIESQHTKEVGAFYYSVLVGEKYHYGTPTKDYNKLILSTVDLKKGDGDKEQVIMLKAHDIQHLELVSFEGVSQCLVDDFSLLNSPKSIQTLEIRKCDGIECIMRTNNEQVTVVGGRVHVPSSALFSRLKKLAIWDCKKMKKLGIPLSQLRNLEHLSVNDCPEIEEIIEEDGNNSVQESKSRGIFNSEIEEDEYVVPLPKLKVLSLYNLPRLESICTNATINFSSMKSIYLSKCPLLKIIQPFSSADQSSLKEITISKVEEECSGSGSGSGTLNWENPSNKNAIKFF